MTELLILIAVLIVLAVALGLYWFATGREMDEWNAAQNWDDAKDPARVERGRQIARDLDAYYNAGGQR